LEKAPRTGEYARNPERKNTPCISDLAGVKFLLKKERVFFFRGSALQVFGQCGASILSDERKHIHLHRSRVKLNAGMLKYDKGRKIIKLITKKI